MESYEQGWRRVPANIERIFCFLLFRMNQGRFQRRDRCWIEQNCPAAVRAACPAWIAREGLYCWFLTGKICRAGRSAGSEKGRGCFECAFFRKQLEKITG